MNNILTKALNELKAEKPRLDYVIGMLETLIEMQGGTKEKGLVEVTKVYKDIGISQSTKDPEAQIIESGAANIDKVKEMARASGAEV